MVGLYEWNDFIILDECFYLRNLTNNDLAQYIRKEKIENQLIIADNARPEGIEELSRSGLLVKPCEKGKDSIINGIGLMKQYKI
jgi:phage terminase large subunit